MVKTMCGPPPGRPDERPDFVSRRQLLGLAGSVGVASMVGACSSSTRSSVKLTASTSAPLLCRDAWGARPAHPGGKRQTITRMTLHHEAVVLGDNRNAPGHLRQDQRYHQDQHGWIDIAYHVGVDRNGNIYELRSTELAGDTATDYDTTGHFLVLCEGDFDQEAVSEAQLRGAALAFAWAARTFGIATNTLAGHRDLAQTSCPGASLYAHLTSGDLKRRIDDLLAAGGVDLQRFCGPDAAARVAAIEAGN
ncbi:peptidoglycan recognition family protein [Mycobacterium sp. IS-1264]|uniref:peptidoglycan recognition protein family protein n=1 Tax=Mycobacterium sp. IS-1264 TaxID=1834158 RepID=UPI001F0A6F7A|nr:peptidoglycan recognition family protein [Mycobacterium sp. IS-1264]